MKPYTALLGTTAGSEDIYVDMRHHQNAVEVPETKIFRFCGSLNFASRITYRKSLYKAIDFDAQKIIKQPHAVKAADTKVEIYESRPTNSFRCLVLDFSALGHCDGAGCRLLTEIMIELRHHGIRMFIANPSDRVFDALMHSTALGEGPFEMFPTLHDAVLHSNACRMV